MSDLSDANLVADEALRLKAENERLRKLIAAIVRVGWVCNCDTYPSECWFCNAKAEDKNEFTNEDAEYVAAHKASCPWPALVAEAEAPGAASRV